MAIEQNKAGPYTDDQGRPVAAQQPGDETAERVRAAIPPRRVLPAGQAEVDRFLRGIDEVGERRISGAMDHGSLRGRS